MEYDLNKFNAKPTPIYSGDLPLGYILDIIPYGNQVYFLESARNMYRTMRYDLENKSLHIMFSEDKLSNPGLYGISDEQLFYGFFYGDPADERSHSIYSSDLLGDNTEKMPISFDFLFNFYVDNHYYYSRPVWAYLREEEYKHIPHIMQIYNKDFEKVDQLDLTDYLVYHHIAVGDDSYLFLSLFEGGDKIIQYLDKSEIGSGSGDLKLKELVRTPFELR